MKTTLKSNSAKIRLNTDRKYFLKKTKFPAKSGLLQFYQLQLCIEEIFKMCPCALINMFRHCNGLYCAVVCASGLFSANASGRVQNFVPELTVKTTNAEQYPPMPSFVGKREKPLSELCKRKRSAWLTFKKSQD